MFLFTLILSWHLIATETDLDYQRQMVQDQTTIGLVRARLESELNSTMYLALGLSSLVAVNPDFTRPQFELMAEGLLRMRPNILNVGLAPDNILTHVYPLRENASAIGLRYLEHPVQRDAVLRMMDRHQPLLAGPVNLVQGGQGLINRIPIYSGGEGGSYWGLASIVVDPAPIYESAGLSNGSFAFALRGTDARGAQGEPFFGDSNLFDDPDAVLMEISVPGGTWILAGKSKEHHFSGILGVPYLIHVLAVLFAIGGGVMIGTIVHNHYRIEALALHDPLTGAPNRRALMQIATQQLHLSQRTNRPFTLIHLDLDGFKHLNDHHGHRAGDLALREVAHRIRNNLRTSDSFARVGGDEFIILLPETTIGRGLHELKARLRDAVKAPFVFEDHCLHVGISMGSATWPDDGSSFDALIKHADERMYIEKREHKERGTQVSSGTETGETP